MNTTKCPKLLFESFKERSVVVPPKEAMRSSLELWGSGKVAAVVRRIVFPKKGRKDDIESYLAKDPVVIQIAKNLARPDMEASAINSIRLKLRLLVE